jgi:cytochrome P450
MLNGYFLPEYTTVGIQAYTLHHDDSVYTDPDLYNPDRWLTTDEEHLKRMNRSSWAFGSGQRGCIAEHLAWLEMKIALFQVYDNFKTEIAEGFEDWEMQVDDQISSIVPAGRRCMLAFKRWDE